jgi:hypothetical protein
MGTLLDANKEIILGSQREIQGDSKLLLRFSWPIIFKPEKNKTKLLTEYESVTQKVLLPVESILQNANNFRGT